MKKIVLNLILFSLIVVQYAEAGKYTGYVIGIDPGHGGSAPGSAGWDGDAYPNEEYINLDVALQLKDLLQNQDAAVQMTRTEDTYVSITARSNYCYVKV